MILFDTNILVYSQNMEDDRYKTCRRWIKKVGAGEVEGVISCQNVTELVSVYYGFLANKKDRVEKAGILDFYDYLLAGMFRVVYPNRKTMVVYRDLLGKYTVSKRRMFDIFLMATMLSNGVREILTYNVKDFADYKEIKTLLP